ncbi:MAG: hypothetical protein KFB93_07025 [Simkaniaceae bacterium]|nr:MAG: hypothetical protein KFB93_07025 [Simkaniaceae bacterium]
MEIGSAFSKYALSFWGSSNPSSQVDRGESTPEAVGNWSDIAADVWNVVKWLFEAFRDNFIVCYLSAHISEADRSIEVTVPRILDRWFNASEIPFSSRMNPLALIDGLKQVESAPIILTFDGELEEISVEDFVNLHVMSLGDGMTRKVPNATKFAFWLSTQDLKRDLQTLDVSVQRDLMNRMGAADFEIDAFVEYCRDKMGTLKAQLELLLPSE